MPRPIIIAISFYLTLALVILLILPKYQDLKLAKKDIEEKSGKIEYQKERFLNIKKASEELDKYSESLAKIDSALPAELSSPDLFNFLQKISAQNGLILKDVSLGTSSQKLPKIKETHLNFTVFGFYSSFKNFLSSLEKSARLIEIEDIHFVAPLKEAPISFELKIKVYSYLK